MTKLIRRQTMALMLGAAAISFTAPFLFDAPVFAKDGGSSGSSGSGSSGSGGDSGSDSGGGGHGGNSGGSGDSGGDDSGNDGGSGDDDGTPDQGSGNDDDNDGDDDDSGKNKDKSAKDAKKSGKDANRPTVSLSLSATELASVTAGTHVVVDQLGRQLELSVRSVNGQTVISGKPHGGAAKRNPGPITNVSVVAASTVAGDDDGTPDQGQGDN